MKYYKTIYVVRFMNAYGDIDTRMVQYTTLQRYIKNWGWTHNGDKSGLEIIEHTFETIFKTRAEEHD